MLPKESDILSLDLGFVEKRLVHSRKWDAEDAAEATLRYKRFLVLISRHPNLTLAPAPDIDEAWHCHILFTREYMRDCDRVFGGYLHHAPAASSEEKEKIRMEEAIRRTAVLYEQTFGDPYLDLDVSSFW